ncbi:hypothetical protein HPT25_06195 [Bacillus sp. BRMEA1]|uniref:hypothetical protein n=1 Tax=Neobacillus endophyticus TaxID=2738405 RepID=UPI001564D9D9|nr:hypothetical protein [Neobacillus endophyticus]NRD77086.1 hypothetical protein [Neobacillus endophyticus]
MIEIEKQKMNDEKSAIPISHQEFIEQKKPAPIQKKKPLPSLEWLVGLIDILVDFFTSF